MALCELLFLTKDLETLENMRRQKGLCFPFEKCLSTGHASKQFQKEKVRSFKVMSDGLIAVINCRVSPSVIM